MKKTTISDAEIIVFALQDEIRRSHEARYDHRLHAVLLVAQGLSCRKVAQFSFANLKLTPLKGK